MRKVWLLASAVLAFLNFVKSQEVARTLYSTRYDNLDIDTILGSNRLVSNYVDCLLSRKPCPPEGKDLKRILPEALRTKCARCSPIQKENALKIITRLYYDYPDQYRALRERWDPSGEYHRRFEEYLRGLQFNQIGGNGGTGVGNTIESGGNDRPVRNDLDRQPATQSSNVQTIVVNPTLAGQPNGNVNTLLPIPPSPTPLPPSAVAPATERPRPPAPVAQILFPTTTDTSTTITTTTSTTTSTSTFNSGPLELTSNAPSASVPSNTVTSFSASILSSSGGTVASSSDLSGLRVDSLDSTATAGPVVPVPIPQGFLPRPTITVSSVAQSLQHGATTTTPFGTGRLEEVSTVPLWLEAQLAQQIPPERPQGSFVDFVPAVVTLSSATFNARPVVDGVGNQNFGPAGTAGQLPLQASVYDGPTTTGRVLAVRRPALDNGFDELPTAPPPVVVNRFGDDDANARPSIAPVPIVPVVTTTSTTTQRPTTTTVRQTRPATRQTTTRNTQRTTTRFITRVPQTPPPTRPPTTFTTTRTSTILQQRPPPQPSPAQQQPILPPQAPPQSYPTIIYERPQAPPRASPPPPPQALPPAAPARPFYVPQEPPRTPPTQYGIPTTPDSIIDHFFVPPSQAANPPLQPSPIVGLWNQLGTKIADTADAIAGMLKKTVDVLVTSHIQSHQRALRRI